MTALPPIDVPWPHRDLHPNSRGHWGKRSRASKKARAAAAWSALEAGHRKLSAEAVNVTAIFVPPDGRRRDLDGMISSIKPTLDGIADVLGIDDSRFILTARKEDPRAPGAVRIELAIVEKQG